MYAHIHISLHFSELKDSLAGDAIEGDVPNLLKVMLATDPTVFKRRRK